MVYERSDFSSDLPENCHYQDEGCEMSSFCLSCPFPRCVYDLPGGGQRWLRERRNAEIIRLSAEGKPVKELAEIFRVSRRSVQRVLRKARGG